MDNPEIDLETEYEGVDRSTAESEGSSRNVIVILTL
jgi:hypothetical protein